MPLCLASVSVIPYDCAFLVTTEHSVKQMDLFFVFFILLFF